MDLHTWVRTWDSGTWHAHQGCPDFPTTASLLTHIGQRPPPRTEYELNFACFWCLKQIGDTPIDAALEPQPGA